jgi:MFS family permease
MDFFSWISLSLFCSLFGSYLLTPFCYSQLQQAHCDIVWGGYLTSIKSISSILAAIATGYVSDRYGRQICLFFGFFATLCSHLMSLQGSSFLSLVLAGVLSSLNQNPAIAKALFADYASTLQFSDAERQRSVGYVGTAAGVAYMTASLVAPVVASSAQRMVPFSLVLSLLSLGILFFSFRLPFASLSLPPPSLSSSSQLQPPLKANQSPTSTVMIPLLLSVRFLMGLAYGLYNLSTGFFFNSHYAFTPTHHSLYMFWIGLTYTLSQAFLGRYLISRFHLVSSSHSLLLIVCCLLIALARETIFSFPAYTDSSTFLFSLHHLSLVLSLLVANTSLGIINILLSLMVSKVAQNTGTLYGLMEAVEKVSAGIIGPTVVGHLYLANEMAPVRTVAALYCLIAGLIWFSSEKIDRVLHIEDTETKKER